MKHIRGPQCYDYGYHEITTIDDKIHNSLMDFGILKLKAGDIFSEEQQLERAYLLISGEMTFEWEGNSVSVNRPNCFDYDPWVPTLQTELRLLSELRATLKLPFRERLMSALSPLRFTPLRNAEAKTEAQAQ